MLPILCRTIINLESSRSKWRPMPHTCDAQYEGTALGLSVSDKYTMNSCPCFTNCDGHKKSAFQEKIRSRRMRKMACQKKLNCSSATAPYLEARSLLRSSGENDISGIRRVIIIVLSFVFRSRSAIGDSRGDLLPVQFLTNAERPRGPNIDHSYQKSLLFSPPSTI